MSWFLFACNPASQTFVEVQSGRITLDPEETKALERLLAATGLPPDQLDVSGEFGARNGAWILDGHIHQINLDGVPVESLSLFAAFQKMTRLVIKGGALTDLRGLGGLKALEWLQINNSGLSSLEGLDECDALVNLLLRHNTVQTTASLAPLPALAHLDLAHNRLQSTVGLAGRKTLVSLDLSDNLLQSSGDLNDLPQLSRLNLARNRIEALQGLHDLPHLQELFLDDNQLIDASALDRIPSLKIINLNGNRLEHFPLMVSHVDNLYWSGNPGYASRLASDFTKERARLLAYDIAPELPSYPGLAGFKSRGGCVWKGKKPQCSATIQSFNGGAKVFMARYDIGSLTTDPRRRGITGIILRLSVKEGTVRIYLNKQARSIQSDQGPQLQVGYAYIEATPGDDKAIAGQLFNDHEGIWFLLETQGEAKGISYELEPGYVP